MKKNIILCLFSITALAACNKYHDVTNAQLSGYVFQYDPLNNNVPVPVITEPVYVSIGTDTVSYILSSKTDSAGYYADSFFSGSAGSIYSRYYLNGTEYFGDQSLAKQSGAAIQINLKVYPHYQNGFAVIITTPDGGSVGNYPFRLYNSESAAIADSVKFAYSDTTTANNGRFIKYNAPPGTYYITAIDSISGKMPQKLGSFTLNATGLIFETITLKQ